MGPELLWPEERSPPAALGLGLWRKAAAGARQVPEVAVGEQREEETFPGCRANSLCETSVGSAP